MDPRIRIHTKMSWIRNTEKKTSMVFSAPPVIHRDWTPPASAKDAASSGEQLLLPFLQGRRLAAEFVYVLRPLIHLMVSECKGYCHEIFSSVFIIN
jgi:hypothetical protein